MTGARAADRRLAAASGRCTPVVAGRLGASLCLAMLAVLVANVSAKVRRELYIALRVLSLPGVARVMLRKSRPLERWESWYRHSLANTRALYEAGVPLIFGTDTPFVFGNFHHSALQEMRALREAGIPTLTILKMATSRAADVLGMGNTIGSIEPGKIADLVLVRGNPLADIEAMGSIDMVMKEGRVVYDQTDIPTTPASPVFRT